MLTVHRAPCWPVDRSGAGPSLRRPEGSSRSFLAAVLLLLTILGAAGGGARPVEAAPAPAASYRLDAAVDLERGTVSVGESVQFRNVVGVALDTVVFRVVPNSVGAFELDAVSIDGQAVERRLDGSVLELALPRRLLPGQTTQIDLRYSLVVPHEPGRISITGRSMALGYWFPIVAVHRGDWDRRQYVDVGDAFFSELADFDVTITTSTPAQVVATGQRVEQDGQRWRFQAPGVREVAAAISPDFVMRQATVAGTMLEVAAASEERAAYYVTRASELLRWCNEKLGPYPYPTLVVVDADLPASFGGLEYSGLIFLSRAFPTSTLPEGSSLDSLYLHELLHQWFYSLVGNDQIADPWMDEALVTYLTYRYYREVRPDVAAGVYERTIAGGGGGAVDSGVYDYPSDPPYFGSVYRRGSRFLEALDARLGDGTFWTLLREHIATYQNRVASPRSFLDRALATSNGQIRPLIADYFSYGAFRTATPRPWTVETTAGAWTNTATVFVAADFPVTRVQVLLDSRTMADGPSNNLSLDVSSVEPGSYVLLVRVWDHDQVLFERGQRVEISR
jgi:aminopeptidase N